MIKDYLTYRYPGVSEADYKEGLLRQGFRIWKQDPIGFFTYRPQGDSLVLGDMFVAVKRQGYGSLLLEAVKTLAQGLGKSCIITFSEDAGENHEDGLKAAKARGFKHHLSLNDSVTMIRGTE